jgi:hypothetical protein
VIDASVLITMRMIAAVRSQVPMLARRLVPMLQEA